MRNIDEHTQPVHLADELPASLGQPARRIDLAVVKSHGRPVPHLRRRAQRIASFVHQAEVPQPQAIKRAQYAQVALERIAALQSQNKGDFPALVRLFDVIGSSGQHRVFPSFAFELAEQIVDNPQDPLQGMPTAVGTADSRIRHPTGG